MNFEYLNQMLKYIEEHLTENIEYKKLAQIVGISEYNLQRIFVFLTDMSLSEYMRKRRLSKAFEELKTTQIKIVDLAVKYNYDSSVSFARAFKQYFHMTPTECRNCSKNYQLFPMIEFHNDNHIYHEFHYEIKEIKTKKLYCLGISDVEYDDFLFKIRELYQTMRNNGLYQQMYKEGMYGVSICENNGYRYYVGSELEFENMEMMIVEQGIYAIFKVDSTDQKEIVKMYRFIFGSWLKSTHYEILDKPEIEIFKNEICYICIPINDKQN